MIEEFHDQLNVFSDTELRSKMYILELSNLYTGKPTLDQIYKLKKYKSIDETITISPVAIQATRLGFNDPFGTTVLTSIVTNMSLQTFLTEFMSLDPIFHKFDEVEVICGHQIQYSNNLIEYLVFIDEEDITPDDVAWLIQHVPHLNIKRLRKILCKKRASGDNILYYHTLPIDFYIVCQKDKLYMHPFTEETALYKLAQRYPRTAEALLKREGIWDQDKKYLPIDAYTLYISIEKQEIDPGVYHHLAVELEDEKLIDDNLLTDNLLMDKDKFRSFRKLTQLPILLIKQTDVVIGEQSEYRLEILAE